jgi:phosphoserine phosphatase
MGTHRFQFSGNGETFLHEHATEFMARVKHAGAACWALTAGPSLNREKIDALVDMGLDESRITDSHSGPIRRGATPNP